MQESPINVLVIDLETFVCCAESADVDTLDWIHEKSQKEDAKVIGKLSIDLEQVHRRPRRLRTLMEVNMNGAVKVERFEKALELFLQEMLQFYYKVETMMFFPI